MRNRILGERSGVALVGALVGALGVAMGLVAAPAVAALPAPAPVSAVQRLDWQPCDRGFFCATATVPLDYRHPTGATIQLAVIKHPATDPAHRIGSMFFNPGGPGGPGTTELPALYTQFPPALRARFDLVSWDPRGIGQSSVLQCFDTTEQEQQLLAPVLSGGYPTGAAQQRLWENIFGRFDQACATHAGELLAHDSTADTARDLDLLRQAVGDPTLNYLGISYGTYLGATYANLFPTKVGAITLDGNIDPVQWATGTDGSAHVLDTYLRLGDDQGSAVALNAFLDLCGRATASSCAFSAGSPIATHAKFDTLLDRLASHPVTVAGTTYTKAVTAETMAGALYHALPVPNRSGGWADPANLLQNLWIRTGGAPAPETIPLPTKDFTLPAGAVPSTAGAPYSGAEALFGVTCSDSPNPRNPDEYAAQADFASARSGVVGPVWVWDAVACARWPVLARDRYAGPWNRPTARPILVVGNTVDPATPYRGAVAMSRELANARLLTVHGYGHTALENHSGCVDAIEDAYFVTGALPLPGTVCQQDQSPFGA